MGKADDRIAQLRALVQQLKTPPQRWQKNFVQQKTFVRSSQKSAGQILDEDAANPPWAEKLRRKAASELVGDVTTSVDPVARAIALLAPYPKLRGKAAMAKLRELDASLFPKFKSAAAATPFEDNFWRRIKYGRKL